MDKNWSLVRLIVGSTVILVHLGAVVSVLLLFTTTVSVFSIILQAVLFVLGGISITALYHRAWTHGAVKFHPVVEVLGCLLYTSPSPRDRQKSRMPSSA